MWRMPQPLEVTYEQHTYVLVGKRMQQMYFEELGKMANNDLIALVYDKEERMRKIYEISLIII